MKNKKIIIQFFGLCMVILFGIVSSLFLFSVQNKTHNVNDISGISEEDAKNIMIHNELATTEALSKMDYNIKNPFKESYPVKLNTGYIIHTYKKDYVEPKEEVLVQENKIVPQQKVVVKPTNVLVAKPKQQMIRYEDWVDEPAEIESPKEEIEIQKAAIPQQPDTNQDTIERN